MPKALAFLSYGLNAAVMLGIALLLAKTLAPIEYSRYSFAVATTQTLVICLFEWVRIASARYYPGPDPRETPRLRGAFIGGQYAIGACLVVIAAVYMLATSDISCLLVACYAVSWAVLDLQFTMLRFDSQLSLFSKLQMFRGFISLVMIVSVALFSRHSAVALCGAILANVFTIGTLEYVRPGYVFVMPTVNHFMTLRRVASYGISAATAGGLHQMGPFLLRCLAFSGASDAAYAAFSLVSDLMQRPYNLLLSASQGVFFPDAVREHDRSPNSDNAALRFNYAIDAWCLLMTFGGAMAFRNELMPLIVKPNLLPYVLEILPYLSAFFLVHVAIQTTCAAPLHLSQSKLTLIMQGAMEIGGIVAVTSIWKAFFEPGITAVACGGLVGAVTCFMLMSFWRPSVNCRLPWASWAVAFLTALVLVVIGQAESQDRITGILLKLLAVGPVLFVGGFVGFAIPFGLVDRLNRRFRRIVVQTPTNL